MAMKETLNVSRRFVEDGVKTRTENNEGAEPLRTRRGEPPLISTKDDDDTETAPTRENAEYMLLLLRTAMWTSMLQSPAALWRAKNAKGPPCP